MNKKGDRLRELLVTVRQRRNYNIELLSILEVEDHSVLYYPNTNGILTSLVAKMDKSNKTYAQTKEESIQLLHSWLQRQQPPASFYVILPGLYREFVRIYGDCPVVLSTIEGCRMLMDRILSEKSDFDFFGFVDPEVERGITVDVYMGDFENFGQDGETTYEISIF